MKIELLEDNAGGLYLASDTAIVSLGQAGPSEGAFPGHLLSDILTFGDWVDDASDRLDERPQAAVVAEYDGEKLIIYDGRMGISGKIYAGFPPL